MKLKNILRVSCVVLIFLNIIVIYKLQSSNKLIGKLSRVNSKLELSNQEAMGIISSTTDALSNILLTEGSKINAETNLIDIKGTKTPVHKLVEKSNVKIYYVPEHACEVCYDYLTEWLKKLSKHEQEEIVTICPKTKIRDIFSYYRDLQIQAPVYGLENELGLMPEKGHVPFFFILNEKLTCQNILVPVKEKPELSITYLNTVFK